MKLRKMVTVSAAALMLAGVGASTTNVGTPVHASRRTVRISNLRRASNRLSRRIRNDKSQVRNINREITRLNQKKVRKNKQSKKSRKPYKQTRKRVKKHIRKNTKKQTNQNSRQHQAMAQIQAQMKKSQEKERITQNVVYGRKVYKVTYNGLGKKLSKKYEMPINNFILKYRKSAAKSQMAINNNHQVTKKVQRAMSRYEKPLTKVVAPMNKAIMSEKTMQGRQTKLQQIKQSVQYQKYLKLSNGLKKNKRYQNLTKQAQRLTQKGQKLNQANQKYLLYRPISKKATRK